MSDHGTQPEPSREADPERREVVRRLAGVGAGLFTGGWILGSLYASRHRPAAAKRWIATGVDPRSLRRPRVAGEVILVPLGEGRVRALDRRCTHLGCRVDLSRDGRQILCPCHGSAFDLDGAPARGPATKPLRRWTVTLDERGRIRVHGPA